MLEIRRIASCEVAAAPERCLALLADAERYPAWAALITSSEVLARDAAGKPATLRLAARVLGLTVAMDCALRITATGAALRRLPYDGDDRECLELGWTVGAVERGAAVDLRVGAALDVPGPARLLRGRVERSLVDDLLADFARAVRQAGDR